MLPAIGQTGAQGQAATQTTAAPSQAKGTATATPVSAEKKSSFWCHIFFSCTQKNSPSPKKATPVDTRGIDLTHPAGVAANTPGTAPLIISVPAGQGRPPLRVAVMRFDYAAVQSDVNAIFGTDQDIGKGISDMLATRLADGGNVTVIDRAALDGLITEQDFSNSHRVGADSAAKIGRRLGVDAIIIGDVTQFGREKSSGKSGKSNTVAVVGINARLVSTQTGEVLASVAGTGEATRSGRNLLGAGGVSGTKSGGIDMASSNFQETILGEATNSAVSSLAQKVEAQAATLSPVIMAISGLVVDVAADGTVVINIGSLAGLKPGDKLAVTRVTRLIRDPATGPAIRNAEQAIGEMTVTQLEAKSAVGKFTGTDMPKAGDQVRNN